MFCLPSLRLCAGLLRWRCALRSMMMMMMVMMMMMMVGVSAVVHVELPCWLHSRRMSGMLTCISDRPASPLRI